MFGSWEKFQAFYWRGCQRGAGIITSSGIRGGEDVITKATRTLWRLPSHITTAMPSLDPSKKPEKWKKVLYVPAEVSTSGNTTVYD